MKLNDVTFLIAVCFLPLWLVWELTVLWLRSKGVIGGEMPATTSATVTTISGVMKNRGYQLTALPFFWSAMTAHWWFNWWRPTWSTPVPTIVFWLLVVGTLVSDILLWNTPFSSLPTWAKFYRAPMVQCVVGFVTAWVLFPQAMSKLQGWRWW